MPWVSIADLTKSSKEIIDTKEKITKIGVDESNAKLIPKGTLLFSFKLSIGKLAFAGTDLYTNEAIAGLTIKDKKVLDKNFLYYFLKQIIHDNLTKAVKGNTLNKEKIKNIQIPIPPLEIQKKIVERIEKLMAKIDEAKKLRKEAMSDASSLIPSALNKIFEEGKKKGWEEKELGGLIETMTPPEKIKKKDFKQKGEYPVIDQSQNEIAGWTDDLASLVNIKKPAVIFGDHTCAIKYCEKTFAQGADGIKILSTNEVLLPKFLYLVLKNKPIKPEGYRRHFSKLKKYKIPLPPLPEQQKIVKYLDSLSEKVRKIQNLQSETEMELKLLEKSVLNNAF